MKSMKGIPLPICKVQSCNNLTRNHTCKYCKNHYTQIKKYGKISERTHYTPNEIEITEKFALIHLYDIKQNLKAKAIIDLDDVEKVKKYKWSYERYVKHVKTGLSLHKLISGSDILQDHKNNNTLDNRKINLRPCTSEQNSYNLKINRRNNKSGAKGVCWCKRELKFRAYININRKQKHLGYYKNLVDAAKAYNIKAIKQFGEFAKINDLSKLSSCGLNVYNQDV